MRTVTTEELKKIQIEILNEIDEICQKTGIKYTLAYGTLLGAVRHGGYIPWDDDIDLQMLSDEFQKLLEYYENNPTRYRIACYETMGSKYRKMHAKVFDPDTVLEEPNSITSGIGVNIDIFILYEIGDTLSEAKKNFGKLRLGFESTIASNWQKYEINRDKSFLYNTAKLFFFIVGKLVSHKRLYEGMVKKLKSFGGNKKYLWSFGSPYRTRDIHDRGLYEKLTKISFENNSYYAIEDYDTFLTQIYGDYMELPPEEKRVTHHDFNAYYK